MATSPLPVPRPKHKLTDTGRYAALVRRARMLERRHGFRLSPDDFGSAQDLRCAMRLFEPASHFMTEAAALRRADLAAVSGIVRRKG